MFAKKLPGQTSFVALLVSGLWTVAILFVIILGHLTLVFAAYGMSTHSNTLAELEAYVPFLKETHLYILAGLAIAADIWIFISHRKERAYKIER